MKLMASFGFLLAILLQASSLVNAAPAASDPCAAIAGQAFVVPSQALACLTSFPYNETIKNNVMTNAERVTDFYTFESFCLDSPYPFQESTVHIREEYSRIRSTEYQVRLISAVHAVMSDISVRSRITLSIVISSIRLCS